MYNIRQKLNEIPKEDWLKNNKIQLEEHDKDFAKLKLFYTKDRCSFCENDLNSFDYQNPCCHWLICPDGMKVKKFLLKLLITEKHNCNRGFFQIQHYLRVLANLEAPFLNINNFDDEIAKRKIIELTIKHKNIEWSFSIDPSDYNGHASSSHSNFPHYHIQIKKNNQVILNFNDFHIPLSEEDLFFFKIKLEAPEYGNFNFPDGESLQDIFKTIKSEEVLEYIKTTQQPENETLHLSTLIWANDGETISGDEISKIFKKSLETKIPIAKLAKENLKNASIQTFISPGEGIPQMQKRSKTKR